MSTEKQRRAFISYSRVNKEFATKLTKGLRSAGYPVWFDQLDIPTGARWDDEVEKALRECSIFLIILTPASIASENVKDEIGYAIDHGKRILPVLLEDCDVPLRLRRFQYVDFTTKSFEEGFESARGLLGDLIDEASIPVIAKPPLAEHPVESKPAPVQAKPLPVVEPKAPAQANPTPPVSAEKKPSTAKGVLIGVVIGVVSVIVLCIVFFSWMSSRNASTVPQAASTSVATKLPPSKAPTQAQKPALPYALDAADAKKLWDSSSIKSLYDFALEVYTQDQISAFVKNHQPIPLKLAASEPLFLYSSVCDSDKKAAEEDLLKTEYSFVLNGKTIPDDKMIYVDYKSNDGRVCYSACVVIDNWTSGQHTVIQTWKIIGDYNDGIYDWRVGEAGGSSYVITVP